jgi:Fe-S cluster biogenesis protein NfuA
MESSELLQDQLSGGIKDIRESLQADQADLEVLGLEDGIAKFRLLVGPETCHECILSKSILEQILVRSLQRTMPQVNSVQLDDPRES